MFWRERFSEALGLQEPNGAVMGYVELPKMFLKTYRAVQEKRSPRTIGPIVILHRIRTVLFIIELNC